MMEINRNNYEAYFIDYLEGTLDERLVDSFIEFIKLNPDLKEELDLFESVSAVPEIVSFNKKDTLYKEKYDSEKEFNTAAVANLEGDISKDEKFEFEMYLAEHPEKKKEASLFSQTKLKADESITFNKKNKLYRKPLGKTILMWSSRVAAVLVLALAIFSLLDKTSDEIIAENEVAEVEEITSQKESVSETQTSPLEENIEVTEKEEKLNTIPAANKVILEKKRRETIPESPQNEIEEEYLALVRIPIEVPAEMKTITASLDVQVPKARMATMYISYPDNYYDDEWLLADKIKEKFGFGKITKAGLNLFTSISNERFTYQTTNDGKVKEYKYDSRLFAFSIPNKKVQPE